MFLVVYPSRKDGKRNKKRGKVSLLVMSAVLRGSCRKGRTMKFLMLNITSFEQNTSKIASGVTSQRQPTGGAENGNDWGSAWLCW